MVGPDCKAKAIKEAEAFCLRTFGETRKQFGDSCDEDFAGDEGITLEEYQERFGASGADDDWFIDIMVNHGLWS